MKSSAAKSGRSRVLLTVYQDEIREQAATQKLARHRKMVWRPPRPNLPEAKSAIGGPCFKQAESGLWHLRGFDHRDTGRNEAAKAGT